MITHSATNDPLTAFSHDNSSPRSSPDRKTSTIPLPVLARTCSGASSMSYQSTSDLIPHNKESKTRATAVRQSWNPWSRDRQKLADSERPKGSVMERDDSWDKKSYPWWHGWKILLFDSWINVLILLIPATWVLKLASTNSETLVFVSCTLAMIPLVKMHDLATSDLSIRIGGSKTGLLNASMSNTVELVVAIIALRKCELRVVQSSLVGSMLSKLLLILGMCFFAGGMRFSHQEFDSSATQIHSSLLSISVGAVLLPAAFHFALSYSSEDALQQGTTLADQKQDILRMSHGVAIVLLIIYASYLIFQLWSHTHLYQDSTVPSTKLPASVSMRSVTSRVRQKSTHFRERERRILNNSKQSFPPTPILHTEKGKAFEVTETDALYEEPEQMPRETTDPYGAQGHRTYAASPFGTSSQVTLANEFGTFRKSSQDDQGGATTVRLVREDDRVRGRAMSSEESSSGNSFDEERQRPGTGAISTGRDSPVSEVLSAYVSERGNVLRRNVATPMMPHAMPLNDRPGGRGHTLPTFGRDEGCVEEEIPREPELSWALTMLLLLTVTVLVAINSTWLVDSMDSLSPTISKEWIGLILLPAVSSIAECVTSINVSVKDQLTLSISVAVGSTIQTALFVIPSMVLLGWVLDKPLAMLFDPFESVVLYISVHTMGFVVADGKSNWLEGIILICLYVVIAVTFWFYPGSNFSSNLAVCSTTTM